MGWGNTTQPWDDLQALYDLKPRVRNMQSRAERRILELEKLICELANDEEPGSKRRKKMLARILNEYEMV